MSQVKTTPALPGEAVEAMKLADPVRVQEIAGAELGRLLAKQQIERPEVPIVDGVMMPATIGQTRRLAEIIYAGGMMPGGWAQKDDQPSAILAKATIALSFAYRLGRDWTWALGAVAVVNNKPCLYGDALPDLIWASGKCAALEETWDGLSGDGTAGLNTVAVCKAKRSDNGAEKVYRFSVKDAQVAGLWGKTGYNGKPTPWVTHPKRMLQMRARAFCLRDLFADVLSGAAVAEEQQDVTDAAREAANAEQRAGISRTIDDLATATTTPQEPAAPAASHETAGDGEGPQHGTTTREEAEEFAALSGLKVQVQGSLLGDDKPNTGTVDTKRGKR